MKKLAKITLGILVFLVILALAALFIADSRYQFLRGNPLVSHEALARPDTSVRVVIHPALAKDFIEQYLGKQGPPDWVLTRVLPYEIAILLTPDLGTGELGVDLFCNAQRLAPVLSDSSASLGLDRSYPYVTWSGNRFKETAKGSLVLEGKAEMGPDVVMAVRKYWSSTAQLSHPRIEGNHVIEAVADNRDGSLYALALAMSSWNHAVLPISNDDLAKSLLTIATVRASADIEPGDTAAIKLTVNCVADAQPGEITATSFLVSGLLAQATTSLKQAYGMDFEGTKKTEGTTITADYTLKPLSNLLRR